MVSFIAHFRFASEDRAEMAEALRLLAVESRLEPGCVNYIPTQVEDDPDTVLVFEQYRDKDAVAAHRNSEHFKKYAVGGLYQKMKDRRLENVLALV